MDRFLFKLVNLDLSNPFFDFLLPLFREKKFWIPLYLFLAYLLIRKYKSRSLSPIFLLLITLTICDQLSSEVIKNIFQRLRPCNDPELKDKINLLVNCGKGYSFTSSHACNHFGLATVFVFIFRNFTHNKRKKIFMKLFFYVWASSIAFAQVYVGVHYPVDVISGAIIGFSVACICIWIYNFFKWDTDLIISEPKSL